MKQYGLIGEKLGHSLSVPIHEAIWEKISLAASYRLIEIPRGELAAVVPELRLQYHRAVQDGRNAPAG